MCGGRWGIPNWVSWVLFCEPQFQQKMHVVAQTMEKPFYRHTDLPNSDCEMSWGIFAATQFYTLYLHWAIQYFLTLFLGPSFCRTFHSCYC